MKLHIRMFLSLVSIAVFLAITGAAQMPPQVKPFSSDLQISTTAANAAQRDVNGKLYVSHNHLRMDLESGGRGAIMITNVASQTTDVLMPEAHMYMEMQANQPGPMARRPGVPDIKALDPNNPCASEEGTTCKNLGTEDVNGRSCDHWQMTDKNGQVSNVWIDQKLHFPIKSVTQKSTWQLTNIKEGEPDASLFEVPAGYRKMDPAMMQGMQGMRPPQQ